MHVFIEIPSGSQPISYLVLEENFLPMLNFRKIYNPRCIQLSIIVTKFVEQWIFRILHKTTRTKWKWDRQTDRSRCSTAVASRPAEVTWWTGRPIKTLVTLMYAVFARAVVIAAAVHGTIHRRPADVTDALIRRLTGTDSLLALIVTTTHHTVNHIQHFCQ